MFLKGGSLVLDTKPLCDFKEDSCLVVVDVQNDFCPGGALGVKDGDKIVPVLNSFIDEFNKRGLPIVYTRDWHPIDHISFAEKGGIWPPHCIQETQGVKFCHGLKIQGAVCSKGFESDKEAYSGFDGKMGGPCGLSLDRWLKERKIGRLYVGGLATDYCVKATVIDGLKSDYEVYVIKDGCRAVDVNLGDGEKSVSEMVNAGAVII